MKSTAVAYSNIAFIKYWGRKNEELRLPTNGSISMTLDNLYTTTTIEFSSNFKEDSFEIDGHKTNNPKLSKHLNRIRTLAKSNLKAKVVSKNNAISNWAYSTSLRQICERLHEGNFFALKPGNT